MIQLYYRPMACSLAARIALYEAGIEAHFTRVDLDSKQLGDGSDFLEISPKGQVPVLRTEEGELLTEGAVVLQYIADQAPHSGLAPAPTDPERYAQQTWLHFIATELHKAFLFPQFTEGTPDPVREHGRQHFLAKLPIVTAHLERHPALGASGFTVADAYLVWALTLARFVGTELPSPLCAYLERMQCAPRRREGAQRRTARAERRLDAGGGAMIGKTIAGVRLPDSKLAGDALALANETSPEWLVHHALRTYVFGGVIARDRGWQFDEELFFCGATLHDLGIVEYGHGPQRFEVEGADRAVEHLSACGLDADRGALLWDAIALHTSRGIADRKEPEIALVHLGAVLDVAGVGADAIPGDAMREVLSALPRLAFKRRIVDAFRTTVEANPASAFHTFTMDLARSCVPGFVCPTTQELIEAAPFTE